MQSREEYHRVLKRWMAEDRHDVRQLRADALAERQYDDENAFWAQESARFYAPGNENPDSAAVLP